MTNETIAFYCDSLSTGPSEFIPLAEYLQKNGLNIIFLFNNMNDEVYNKLIDKKFKVFLKNKELKNIELTKQKPNFKILRLLKNFKYNRDMSKKMWNFYSELLVYKKVSTVIVYTDRSLGIGQILLKIAKKKKLPILRLQITRTIRNRLLHTRLNNKECNNQFINKIIKLFYKNDIILVNEKLISFYSYKDILMYFLFYPLPKYPWNNGDSSCDYNLMISKQHILDEINEGSFCKNSKIVGQFSHNDLFKSYQNRHKIKRELIFKYFDKNYNNEEIVVFAMPQFFEHQVMKKNESLDEIYYILDSLSKFNDKLILCSLHPKMNYNDYSFINDKYLNIKIVKHERLSRILPIGDFFIGAFESTVSWALISEIVPIFLDYYGLGFDLSKYSSVQNLKNKSYLGQDLQNIFGNKSDIQKNILKEKEFLPPFDGKSGNRILNEIRKAIHEK